MLNTAPDRFRLITLGTPALVVDTAALPVAIDNNAERLLGPGKPLALLAYCCSVREREHPRDYLTTMLWSDSDATRARQNLRQTMWRLRSVIGDAFVATDEAILRIAEHVKVDRDEFVQTIHRNDAAAALSIYNGAFLQGMSIPGGDEFEDWAANERRHLEESLIRVVIAHAKELTGSGRIASVRDTLGQLLKRTPENVDAHRLALDLALQISEHAQALSIADTLELLARAQERDTPAIQSLIARARKPMQPTPQATEAVTLDLVGREDVFSAAMRSWAHARTGTTTAISLTGAPGIGKTRLLTALAQRCRLKGAIAVSVKANQGERDVNFAFAAAIARALAVKPGAAGISAASARELVALDPSLGSQFAANASLVDNADGIRTKALAIIDLLGAICEHQPLALLLDDLHWSDAASRQMLSIIIARATELPLMFVIAFRGYAQPIGGDSVENFPLLPLRTDEVVDAIRSTGKWPDDPSADAFVNALASACEGVPLVVVERLSLVKDKELLTFHQGTWSSNDWSIATAAVSVAAPVDQRLASCTDHERRVLLAIAVSGVPLTESALRRILHEETETTAKENPSPAPERVATSLANLEVRGLLVRMNDVWVPVHDVIAERLVDLSSLQERIEIHRELARVAADGDDSLAATALRHFIVAADDVNAAVQFRRLLNHVRSLGDSRDARSVLLEHGGDRISEDRIRFLISAIPLWGRQGRVRARWLVGPLIAACLLFAAVAFKAMQQPRLVVSQLPTVTYPLTSFSMKTLRTMPSVAITIDQKRFGDSDRIVHVRSTTGGTKIVAGDSVSVVDGVALFNALRFESSDPVIRLQFESDGFAPVDVSVPNSITTDAIGIEQGARVRIVGGRLSGTRLSATSTKIAVAPGAAIEGFVQAEYTTSWPTASVWLSVTPTWGEAQKVGLELSPVMTPVRREVIDVPLWMRAPDKPGHYWLIFLVDAEDSGGYSLSRTNWTVRHPIWNDDNNVATLADSIIERANMDGSTTTRVAYLREWPNIFGDCTNIDISGEPPLKLCARPTALFGLEVIVK